jgi:hypothetical protein
MDEQFQINFLGFVLALALVPVSPYSALILALFVCMGRVTDFDGLWMFALAGFTLAFLFRLVNPKR